MVVFKEIKGHDSAYLVGDDGTVFNRKTGKFVKAVKGNNGYMHLTLCYGEKRDCMVHRLVAETFISNPHNYPCVNHIDENKENNAVSNLEWCTQQRNSTYGKMRTIRNTPIIQNDMNDNFIKEWQSIKEASEHLQIKGQGISRVCRGFRKSCGGYKWKYAESPKKRRRDGLQTNQSNRAGEQETIACS